LVNAGIEIRLWTWMKIKMIEDLLCAVLYFILAACQTCSFVHEVLAFQALIRSFAPAPCWRAFFWAHFFVLFWEKFQVEWWKKTVNL
jgi:hypothetical protein